MANNASDIIKYLYNVLGCDNFVGFIKLLVDEQTLDQKLANNLTKPFVQQKEKRDRGSFLELVKEQRKQKGQGTKGELLGKMDKENDLCFDANPALGTGQPQSFKKVIY